MEKRTKLATKINCPNCPSSLIRKQLSLGKFSVFLCSECGNSFTYPVPNNLAYYYQHSYWISPGVVGRLKSSVFRLFQKRRVKWLQLFVKKGAVLDVGAGEGTFIKSLPSIFQGVGIDSQTAEIANPQIINADFLKWRNSNKFDAIVFWESLEHVTSPQKYLSKAHQLLKPKGYILIEYPRFDSLEARLFGKFWFHLDLPRHLFHFTRPGLTYLLNKNGFTIQKFQTVAALEYSVAGLVISLLKIVGANLTDDLKQSRGIIYLMALLPLLLIALLIQIIFYCLRQSSIGLIVAKKNG